MILRSLTLMTATLVSVLVPAVTATAGMIVANFDLSTPQVSVTEARFDVSLLFSGDPTDQIEAYQLSVYGSSPLLTLGDVDFSRFSFIAASSPTPLDAWFTLGTIGLIGLEPGIPFAPQIGPFITPAPDPLMLGTLIVDLTGITPGTHLNVTLAGGVPGLQTDVGGTFNGQFVPSVADSGDPDLMLTFSDLDGVSFQTIVPEPPSAGLWSCLGFILLFGRRASKRGPRRRGQTKQRRPQSRLYHSESPVPHGTRDSFIGHPALNTASSCADLQRRLAWLGRP